MEQKGLSQNAQCISHFAGINPAQKDPIVSMGLPSPIKVNSADCKYRVTLLIPRMDWDLLKKRKRRLKKDTAELLEFLLKRHQRGNEKF